MFSPVVAIWARAAAQAAAKWQSIAEMTMEYCQNCTNCTTVRVFCTFNELIRDKLLHKTHFRRYTATTSHPAQR